MQIGGDGDGMGGHRSLSPIILVGLVEGGCGNRSVGNAMAIYMRHPIGWRSEANC